MVPMDKPNPLGYLNAALYLDRKQSSPDQTGLVSSLITTPNPESINPVPSLDELTLQPPLEGVEPANRTPHPEISPYLKAQIINDAIRAKRRYFR